MITDPTFYILAALAVIIVGLSKSGFGSGIGVLGVPLMALVIPPAQAAAIMLPLEARLAPAASARYSRQRENQNTIMLASMPSTSWATMVTM